MTEDPGADGDPSPDGRAPEEDIPGPTPSPGGGAAGQDILGLAGRERDALLAWVGENLTLVRRSASGQRVLYWSLGIGFAVGLAAHVGGFLLKASATTEPWMVFADLLYALGWAMWTSFIVVIFVQVYPEVKKRQYKEALDAYEATISRRTAPGSNQAGNKQAVSNQASWEDWPAEMAEIAADIRDLDPMADGYEDQLAALREKLKTVSQPATEPR